MKAYNRVMAGRQGIHLSRCIQDGFIGVDYDLVEDLSGRLPEDWREFNHEFIPIFLRDHPGKSKIAAGLACGFIWTLTKGLKEGDVVISPDGSGTYRVGEITGPYHYVPGDILPHRRPVHWFEEGFKRSAMSEALQRSTNSTGTCCDISGYAEELERLIGGHAPPSLVANDPDVEDAASFAMEKHLEDFLVQNWGQTELGKDFDIYTEDGELVGQQYQTDTGPMDILAISKDRETLLVVELKKGRASDKVVGQVLRYMGYVQEELCEPGQGVKGVIIAQEDDTSIRRALVAVPSVSFMRYQISFRLVKG